MYLTVSVDTEEDNQWNLQSRLNPTVENIKYLEPFQLICEQYGIKPVYLCTYTVADNRESSSILKGFLDKDKCEIGSHLHVWTTPPIQPGSGMKSLHECHLTKDLHEDLIGNLTQKLEATFETKMRSYRAGRYGQNCNGIEILEKYGYLVDSSVVSGVNYHVSQNGTDFSDAPLCPYHPSTSNLAEKGSSRILEIPITNIGMAPLIGHRIDSVRRKFPGLWRIFAYSHLVKTIFLRPTFSSLSDMIILCEVVSANKLSNVLNFMIHSSEFMPGCSPYNKDTSQVKIMLDQVNKLFDYLVNVKKVKPNTYKDFHRIN